MYANNSSTLTSNGIMNSPSLGPGTLLVIYNIRNKTIIANGTQGLYLESALPVHHIFTKSTFVNSALNVISTTRLFNGIVLIASLVD